MGYPLNKRGGCLVATCWLRGWCKFPRRIVLQGTEQGYMPPGWELKSIIQNGHCGLSASHFGSEVCTTLFQHAFPPFKRIVFQDPFQRLLGGRSVKTAAGRVSKTILFLSIWMTQKAVEAKSNPKQASPHSGPGTSFPGFGRSAFTSHPPVPPGCPS